VTRARSRSSRGRFRASYLSTRYRPPSKPESRRFRNPQELPEEHRRRVGETERKYPTSRAISALVGGPVNGLRAHAHTRPTRPDARARRGQTP
jgi:hypothetical protein